MRSSSRCTAKLGAMRPSGCWRPFSSPTSLTRREPRPGSLTASGEALLDRHDTESRRCVDRRRAAGESRRATGCCDLRRARAVCNAQMLSDTLAPIGYRSAPASTGEVRPGAATTSAGSPSISALHRVAGRLRRGVRLTEERCLTSSSDPICTSRTGAPTSSRACPTRGNSCGGDLERSAGVQPAVERLAAQVVPPCSRGRPRRRSRRTRRTRRPASVSSDVSLIARPLACFELLAVDVRHEPQVGLAAHRALVVDLDPDVLGRPHQLRVGVAHVEPGSAPPLGSRAGLPVERARSP